jgi:hypothetical protein
MGFKKIFIPNSEIKSKIELVKLKNISELTKKISEI